MPINSILFILFISVCALTLSVIKLYSELTCLKEYISTTRDIQYKLIKEVDERCSKSHLNS